MKFLLGIVKWLLYILLLCLVLAVLTALSWWLRWPLLTGVFVLVGLMALVLLAIIGRKALEWRDKRSFIRSVRQFGSATESATHSNPFATVWNKGMGSAGLFSQAKGGGAKQNWYLVFDETGSASRVFDSMGSSLPEQGKGQPLRWHFCHSAKFLQYNPKEADGSLDTSWENILALISGESAARSLQGVILLLSMPELNDLPQSAIANSGIALRQRLVELMLAVNANLPIYTLVQGLDDLPGAGQFLSRIPEAIRQKKLGEVFDSETEADAFVTKAFLSIKRTLSKEYGKTLLEEGGPRGNELLFWDSILSSKEKIVPLLEPLFAPAPHQDPLLLRGLFFSETHTAREEGVANHSAKPAFLPEVLLKTIPGTSVNRRPLRGYFSMFGSLKAYAYVAWLLLLLSACGLLSANMLFQSTTLAYRPAPLSLTDARPPLPDLIYHMNYITHLERARKSWILPTLGLNMLERRENEEKEIFTRNVIEKLLIPRLAVLRAVISSDGAPKEELIPSASEYLWLCEAVTDRIEKGETSTSQNLYPLTILSEGVWSISSGLVVKNALNWVNNPQQLDLLRMDLLNLLAIAMKNDKYTFFETFFSDFEDTHSFERVCLSQYWPRLENESSANMCIPARFTAKGNALLRGHIEDFLIISSGNEQVEQKMREIVAPYYVNYDNYWRKFIIRFTEEASAATDLGDFATVIDSGDVASLPHIKFLRTLETNIQPLARSPSPPGWVEHFTLLAVMMDISLELHKNNQNASFDDFLGMGVSAPDKFQFLWDKVNTAKKMRESVEVIRQLTAYFTELRTILQVMQTPALALPIASAHFAGTDAQAMQDSPFTTAQRILKSASTTMAEKELDYGMLLLENTLYFLKWGITLQAAHTLQLNWENEILASPEHLYDTDNMEAVYGKGGIVSRFKETRLMPLLNRTPMGFSRGTWETLSFPFTNDFLSFLTNSEMYSTKQTPKEEYSIIIRSQPPLVNLEAKERPDSVTLSLKCNERVQKLVNKNYPSTATFSYSPAICGATDLTVAFPSFTLTVPYDSFLDFIFEYQYGESTLTPETFAHAPKVQAAMQAAQVNEVTIFLLPDDTLELFKAQNLKSSTIPDRITYAW